MTVYINWSQLNQPIKGDFVPVQGNPSDDYESVATTATSGAAPEGTNYAWLWSTVATVITINNLRSNNIGNGKDIAIPANTIIEIPNIYPLYTTFTVNDIA